MTIRVAAVSLAAACLLALAACDNRDYEAEIASLQGDLENARSETEQLQTEIEGLRSQAEQALSEDARTKVQTELNNVVQTAATAYQQMGSISQQTDVPAGQRTEALNAMRDDLQTIVQSVQAVAGDLGVELETVSMDTDADATEGAPKPEPEPAAGPDQTQPQEPAAQPEQPSDTQTEQPNTSQ